MLKELFLLLPFCGNASYFADNWRTEKEWAVPIMLPWEPMRATKTSILVTWTAAWNPHATVTGSRLQRRWPVRDAKNVDLRNRNQELATWYDDTVWSEWTTVYEGPGRAFESKDLLPGHPYEFRVQTLGHGPNHQDVGASPFSVPQMTHTIWEASQERFPIWLRGTSLRNMEYTMIEIDRVRLYHRRDETGLILFVFDRFNLEVVHQRTYDTMHKIEDAELMAKDLRKFDQQYMVMIVSSDAWEWHVTPQLARVMEYCGAYHFGQWSRMLSGDMPLFDTETGADTRQDSGQQNFGHPYAFIGIPGLGQGMGWEVLQNPTSHYLRTGLVPYADIRGVLYLDYVGGMYHVSLASVKAPKSVFYAEGLPPGFETVHNPITFAKWDEKCELPNCRRFGDVDDGSGRVYTIPKQYVETPSQYSAYQGELRTHFDVIFEANGSLEEVTSVVFTDLTSPPHYHTFRLETRNQIYKFDPRFQISWDPRDQSSNVDEEKTKKTNRLKYFQMTELERLWGGSSERYWWHIEKEEKFLQSRWWWDNDENLPVFEDNSPETDDEPYKMKWIPYADRYCHSLINDLRFDASVENCLSEKISDDEFLVGEVVADNMIKLAKMRGDEMEILDNLVLVAPGGILRKKNAMNGVDILQLLEDRQTLETIEDHGFVLGDVLVFMATTTGALERKSDLLVRYDSDTCCNHIDYLGETPPGETPVTAQTSKYKALFGGIGVAPQLFADGSMNYHLDLALNNSTTTFRKLDLPQPDNVLGGPPIHSPPARRK